MTLFEYVAVAASLICSFAAVRLLGGVAPTLRPEVRYWVHAAWVLFLLFLLSIQWWFFWAYRDVEWDYARFVLALSPLGLLYIQSTIVVPSDAARVKSWRVHYFAIRPRIFGIGLAMLAAMVLCTVVLLGHPALHWRRVLPGSMAVFMSMGLVSEHPRMHGVIAVALCVLTVVASVVFVRPGAFGIAP